MRFRVCVVLVDGHWWPIHFLPSFRAVKKKPQKRIDHATGANGLMPAKERPDETAPAHYDLLRATMQ